MIKCNSLDLSLFQFDFDLTFAAFFLRADHTIYARYGTRTSQDADQDVALEGLAATMTKVLELHENYDDKVAEQLLNKQPVATETKVPEDYPSLKKFKPSLDYKGSVAKSCIHCHQIRDARREEYRASKKPLPDALMFPYPIPQSIGVKLDPTTKSEIEDVSKDSFADAAGLKSGDSIESADEQLIASAADLQWVLHNKKDSDLRLIISRDGEEIKKQITLPEDWRNDLDISWRVTSWEFRRMALGGMRLEPLEDERRSKIDVPRDNLALHIAHVGKYGNHAIAHRAGIKPGDILIEYGGRRDLLTESKLFEYGVNSKKQGEQIKIVVLRDGKEKEFTIKLP